MPTRLPRHLLATIAYRFQATIHDAPPDYPEFEPGQGVRCPRELVVHCVHVLRFARRCFDPDYEGPAATDLDWPTLVASLHEELGGLDRHLQRNDAPVEWTLETLVQGPLADVLTHVGQLAMIRRLSGSPVPGQSYVRARIEVGRVGPDQPTAEPPLL